MNETSPTIRKAAILLAAADAHTAELLLAQMSPEEAAAVRSAAESLDGIPENERRAVVSEFCRLTGMQVADCEPSNPAESNPAPSNPAQLRPAPPKVLHQRLQMDSRLGGIDLCSPLVESLLNRSATDPGQQRPDSNATIVAWLERVGSDSLAEFLSREQPQTIAVVLVRLAPHQAAEVLRRLSSSLQAEVVQRMATTDATDPDILREVEQGVEAWLASEADRSRRQAAGVSAATRLLAASSNELRQTVLASLAARDAELARRLAVHQVTPVAKRPSGLTLADVLQADHSTLATIFAAADRELAALALTGVDQYIMRRLQRALPPVDWIPLRSSVENMGATRLSDVEAAQQEMVALALELEAEGQIDLSLIRPVDVTA